MAIKGIKAPLKTRKFCEGQESAREKPQCIGTYMSAHGAKIAKFVRVEGCEHATDAAVAGKDSF